MKNKKEETVQPAAKKKRKLNESGIFAIAMSVVCMAIGVVATLSILLGWTVVQTYLIAGIGLAGIVLGILFFARVFTDRCHDECSSEPAEQLQEIAENPTGRED